MNKEEDKGVLLVLSSLDAVLNLHISRELLDHSFYYILQKQLEQQDDISIKGLRLSLDLLKEAHIHFIENSAFAKIPLDISAATNAVLGSITIDAVIELDFRLDLEIEDQSILKLSSELTAYRWKRKPELEVLKIKFNLNRFLGKLIEDNKNALESKIDAIVSGFNVRPFILDIIPQIEQKFNNAWQPIRLKHKILPKSFVIHPQSANRKFNDIKIAVASDVHINNHNNHEVDEKRFRIELSKIDQNKSRLNTKLLINAVSINQILSEFYRDQTFEYQGNKLVLSHPQVTVEDDIINITANLDGFLNARLNIRFKAYLNNIEKSLALSDVHIDIKTSGLFDKTKAFLIKSFVLHKLKKNGQVEFELIKNLLQAQVNAFLKSRNNDKLSSHINLLSIDIQSFRSYGNKLELELDIEFKNSFRLMPGILDAVL